MSGYVDAAERILESGGAGLSVGGCQDGRLLYRSGSSIVGDKAYFSGTELLLTGNLGSSAAPVPFVFCSDIQWQTGALLSYDAVGSCGLGSAMQLSHNNNLALQLVAAGISGAGAVGIASCFDVGQPSMANASTTRIHSFGWANDSDVYTELAAVFGDGHMVLTGSLNVDVAASATGSASMIHGTSTTEGLKTVVQEQTLSPSAVETSMSTAIPKGSVIRAVLANCQTALTGGGTTVTWSVGTAGDPDKYGTAGHPTQADSLAKNSKSGWIAGPLAQLTADETIVLTGAATGGAADGNTALTVGSVRIVVVYDTFAALADAA